MIKLQPNPLFIPAVGGAMTITHVNEILTLFTLLAGGLYTCVKLYKEIKK